MLLIIADDVGVDRVGAYAEHPHPGRTPTIDALAERGVLFRNAWAKPQCSPPRATLFTGRYGFSTGIGIATPYLFFDYGLSPDEWSLPDALADVAPGAYRSALAQKWRLGTILDGPGHAASLGWEIYSGPVANINSYYNFNNIVDRAFVHVHEYATTDVTDDALRMGAY